MKSYAEHIQSTSKNITDVYIKKVSSKCVFRSSAIFPIFINKNLNARLLFLGYWMIKKNIKLISSTFTIRNEKGATIYRDNFEIYEVKSYEIDVKKCLSKLGSFSKFTGSVEIEFFSNKNLIFPYPAVTINYFSKTSSTFVHTTSRIYNDYDDKYDNNKILVKESGFDLFLKNSNEPYISFVNGPNFIKQKNLTFEYINHKGNIKILKKSLKNLNPYESVFFKLKFNDKVAKFLQDKDSMVKIKHSFSDFYPRFMVGNYNKKKDMTSLTHSYYDTSNSQESYNFWKNPNKSQYHDAIFSMPIFKEYLSYLVIYPIISIKKPIILSIEFYDQGKFVNKIDNFFIIERNFSNRKSILLNQSIKGYNKNTNYLAKISINSSSFIPSRLKFGMNINSSFKNIFPTNICFNARVANKYNDEKPSAFKWAPIINHNNSFFNISNISFRKKNQRDANLILKFWRTKDNKFLRKNVIIRENCFYNFHLKNNKSIMNFLCDDPGWVTVQSNNSNLDAWYFEDMNEGSIGGDHFF